jgi:hypothetical protein
MTFYEFIIIEPNDESTRPHALQVFFLDSALLIPYGNTMISIIV